MYGVVVLLIYAVAMIGATRLLCSKSTTAESFHVGNRNMGTISSGLSIAATWIWAPALFVSAEKAYSYGSVGLFWFVAPNIACLLLFIPFARKMRAKMPNGITLAGFMGKTYHSERVRNVYTFQLGALAVLSTAVQLLAGGKVLSIATGLPFPAVTAILSAVAYAYSYRSGIRASVLTDAVQMVVMLAACIVLVPWALHTGGGLPSVMQGFAGATGEYTSLLSEKGIEVFVAFGLPTAIGLLAGPFGDQCFWQRMFSISRNKIGKSLLLGTTVFAVVPLSMGVLGLVAAGTGFAVADMGLVNFELVSRLLPTWATGVFLFMLISGLLSTVDSNLCAFASLTSDQQVIGKLKYTDRIRVSRLFMVVLLLLSNLIACIPTLSVAGLFMFYGILRATTFLPTVMTLIGKKLSARAVHTGVIASLAVGLPLYAYGSVCGYPLYTTIGSVSALLLAGVVSVTMTRMEAHNG